MGTVVRVVAAGGAFLAAFAVSHGVMNLARPLTPKEKQDRLEQSVASMKKNLPQQVHPIVIWFDVEAGNQALIYKYKILASRETIMARRSHMEKEMKGSMVGWAAKWLLPEGVRVQCDLYDENESFMYSLDLE